MWTFGPIVPSPSHPPGVSLMMMMMVVVSQQTFFAPAFVIDAQSPTLLLLAPIYLRLSLLEPLLSSRGGTGHNHCASHVHQWVCMLSDCDSSSSFQVRSDYFFLNSQSHSLLSSTRNMTLCRPSGGGGGHHFDIAISDVVVVTCTLAPLDHDFPIIHPSIYHPFTHSFDAAIQITFAADPPTLFAV